MRTLPSVTLQACSATGHLILKVFFPFENAALRSKLEQLGLYWDKELRASVIRDSPGLVDKVKAAIREDAFVVVKSQPGNPKRLRQSEEPLSYKAKEAAIQDDKATIKVSAIGPRKVRRIKVEMPYDPKAVGLLRTIEGTVWSQTKRCWHLPYDRATYMRLKELFNVEVESPEPIVSQPEQPQGETDVRKKQSPLLVEKPLALQELTFPEGK